MEIESIIAQWNISSQKTSQEEIVLQAQTDETMPTSEELKDYLKTNGVKFHHLSKYETLYKLYQEHKSA